MLDTMNHNSNSNLISEYAPIVLFVFNRLDHTKATIDALIKNELAPHSALYVISDGPKKEEDVDKVNKIREYLRQIRGFKEVHIIQRKRNHGLANNIISGITKLVHKFGRIIVLEDDIITAPCFLTYMNDALTKYQDEKKVMSIASYIPKMKKTNLPDYFFMPWFDCWGWATWSDRWDYFERNPRGLIKESDMRLIKTININGSSPDMWSTVIDNYKGKKKTWAIFYLATICRKQGLVLYPKMPFCGNIGFDGTGENCSIGNVYDVEVNNIYNNSLPDSVYPHRKAIRMFEQFNYRRIAFGSRFLYIIKQILFLMFKNTL